MLKIIIFSFKRYCMKKFAIYISKRTSVKSSFFEINIKEYFIDGSKRFQGIVGGKD